MKAVFFAYPACSTCRNARRWLDEHGVACDERNIAQDPPSCELLRTTPADRTVPLRPSISSTSGQLYRAGNYAERLATMDEDSALGGFPPASHGMLIRRPLLLRGDTVLVGFDAAAYARALLGSIA